MLSAASTYEETAQRFTWRIPERFNIGRDVTDRHASGDALALIVESEDGTVARYSFQDMSRLSNRLANSLAALGCVRGDRVGILLGQGLEAALAHVAAYKLGAVALPLFTLFGEDALAFRLADAGARFLITEAASLPVVTAIRDRLPDLETVVAVGAEGAGLTGFESLLDQGSDRFTPVGTAADDPALIIYTSGTTGNPKGALHAHRVLLGHLPGVEFPHRFFPQPSDLFWTPADWAWIGGLLDVLLPAWHHGVPVLARRMRKFDPEEAFALMARHRVRNVFMPATALRLLRQVPDPLARHGVALRSLASGGETLGTELLDWGRAVFGLTINEFYGQTECNLVVGNNADVLPLRPGSMGRPIPGHRVAVVDDQGHPVPAGTLGSIAVARPDPVMFLGYWNNPQATEAKFRGDWMVTGDTGRIDDEGYFWFAGRDDDLITSAGYRIGPGEIEDCLVKHPAVTLAAVIGVPDPVRTEAVKAFVVLRQGVEGTEALKAEIQDFVKRRLAAHEYPRMVEFIDALPTTTTGKIIRKALRERG